MPRAPFLLSLTALALGWALGRSDHGVAWAGDERTPEGLGALQCRAFRQDLEASVVLETSDRTSEVGQWVAAARAAGWQLHGVDFEVAQKPNGFPQGLVHVCLSQRP